MTPMRLAKDTQWGAAPYLTRAVDIDTPNFVPRNELFEVTRVPTSRLDVEVCFLLPLMH
jgi:hypothetical protein